MTYVSFTDCCHLLAIDLKTLRRWMSLSGLSAQPHPNDARLKCLTREQIRQLATTHRRTLPDDVQPEISLPGIPPSAPSVPVLSGVLPDFSAYMADLTKQLVSLQAHVVTLQHQLTLLHSQLQKEQQWRSSMVLTTAAQSLESSQEKSLESSQEKSLESSQENPLESSQDKSLESSRNKSLKFSQDKSLEPSQQMKMLAHVTANVPSIDRRKHPHVLPRVEYGVQGKYVVICPEQGLLEFEPDSPEWFAWLSTLPSFRFSGQLGRFTAHRGGGCLPTRGWRASRHIRNRSYNLPIGKTDSLTIAALEQAAATLQAHLS